MTENMARKADAQGSVLEAIELYEELIRAGSASLLDYLNLICIYFNCMDFGYASAHHVGKEIESKASGRALELISKAESRFGTNDELEFWKAYIPLMGWGEEVAKLNLSGDSLIPYILLANEDPSDTNLRKARELYEELRRKEESERVRLLMARVKSIISAD